MQWSSISSRWAGVKILISFGQVVAHLSHFSCLRVISCKNSRTWLRSCNVICPLQRCWAWALTWGHGHTRHPWVPCSTARMEDVTDRWAASRASSSASASVWLKKKGFSMMPLIQSGFKTWKSVSALLHVIQCVCVHGFRLIRVIRTVAFRKRSSQKCSRQKKKTSSPSAKRGTGVFSVHKSVFAAEHCVIQAKKNNSYPPWFCWDIKGYAF